MTETQRLCPIFFLNFFKNASKSEGHSGCTVLGTGKICFVENHAFKRTTYNSSENKMATRRIFMVQMVMNSST